MLLKHDKLKYISSYAWICPMAAHGQIDWEKEYLNIKPKK
jgi:hypothetical protein